MKKTLLCFVLLLTMVFNFGVHAQQRVITGTVTSEEDGLGLPGVNVLVEGTNRGVITDLDGDYSIPVDKGETLVFSFVGYLTQEYVVGQDNTLDVVMQADTKTLGEVLVVGYGSTTKGDLTGNISSIKGSDLATVPVVNFQDALQGRMAGVFVQSSSVNFSASGGDEKTRFFLSGAYDQQTGILIRNDFERISARLNLDHSVSEKFLIGANFSFSRTENNILSNDNEFNNPIQLVALAPITPIRDENGVLYDRPTTTYYNNLIDSENSEWLNLSYRNLTNLFGEYEFFDDLKFRTEVGVDVFTQNEERFFGSRTNTGLSINGFGRSRWTRILNYNTNNYFTYTKTLAGAHQLEAVLGMSFQKSDQHKTSVEGQEFPLDDLKTLFSAAEITGGTSSVTNFSFLSYFARVNYKYGQKYLATLSSKGLI